MHRKQFEVLAQTVRELPRAFDEPYWRMANSTYRDEVAVALAETLAKTNPRFDRKRFLLACDVPEDAACMDPKAEQIMGVWLDTESMGGQS